MIGITVLMTLKNTSDLMGIISESNPPVKEGSRKKLLKFVKNSAYLSVHNPSPDGVGVLTR
jgi:hypothetical protein